MKTLLAFVVFFAIILATNYFVPITADSVSIRTDKLLYPEGEQITFLGTVEEADFNEPVNVVIRDSDNNFVVMGSSFSGSDGKFEIKVSADEKFVNKGMYTVTLFLNDVQTDEKTYFDFSPDGSTVIHSEAEEQLIHSINSDQNFVEEVSVGGIEIVDSSDNELQITSVYKQILISAEVTNLDGDTQSFSYIVQIKDENEANVALSWVSGILSSEQTFDVSVSWTPEEEGIYEAEIFVWDEISGGLALSEPQKVPIIVV